MSLVDSAAAFERKCKDLRGGEDLFNGLIGLGIRDFSTLAFTLGTPQKPPQMNSLICWGRRCLEPNFGTTCSPAKIALRGNDVDGGLNQRTGEVR